MYKLFKKICILSLLLIAIIFSTNYTLADEDNMKLNAQLCAQKGYGYDPEFGCIIQEAVIEEYRCKGVKLNTKFPIIGDCIGITKGGTNATNVFPKMIGALIKIVSSVIIIVCFILLIVAGIKMSANDPKGAKSIIIKVAWTIALLGLSGVILRLINPTFFG